MRDDRFHAAFLSLSRHELCGKKLKPFCLRHRLTLQAIDSPLLPGSPKAGKTRPEDLMLAARICSMADPFEAVKGASFWEALRWVKMLGDPPRFLSEISKWRAYLKDTAQHPNVMVRQDTSAPKERGVDWMLSVTVSLMEMGFTEEQAWTMPEGRAMFYFYARAIRLGAEVDIITTEHDNRIPQAKEAVADAIKKAKEQAAKAVKPAEKVRPKDKGLRG